MFFLLLAASLAAAPCRPVVDARGPELPADLVAEVGALARDTLGDLRVRLGSDGCAPVTVTLVPAMEDASRLDPPWHLPAWAAGAAQPALRRVVVGVTANRRVQDRARTLRHELAHIVAAEAAGVEHTGRPLPRWLDEGIARVVAGEHGVEDMSVLARARVGGRFLPLSALERGFPADAADAALAYAEAGRAVALLEGGDADALPKLLLRLRTGEDLDGALRAVTGRAGWQLDRDVRRSVSRWAALATVGVETDLAMAACGAVVAVAGLRARRRFRARLAALDPPSRVEPEVVLVRFRLGPGLPA